MVVIPFTLCSLLLCNDMTGERAGVAQSPPPRRPGLPAVNRRFAVTSAYSFRLIGYGRRQRPCKAALSAHPCASPRPEGKRLSDLQPDRGIADSPQSFRKQLYCFCIKNYWGSLSPQGEGADTKNGNDVAVLLYLRLKRPTLELVVPAFRTQRQHLRRINGDMVVALLTHQVPQPHHFAAVIDTVVV